VLNKFSKYQLVFIHIIIWVGFALVLSQLGIMQFPNNQNLLQWDAGWYFSIFKNGYEFVENAQCNIAFFPMFPLFWKFSELSFMAISLFNILCFVVGILLLSRTYNFSNNELLVALSFPSLFFCYIPYSEALFFLSVSIFLSGFKKQSNTTIMLGLLLSGLCRSTSILFFPAFIFIELATVYPENNFKKAIINILQYASVAIFSLVLVAIIQFYYTERWFDFLFVQKLWNKAWQLPKLPLNTWDGSRLLWLDGTALLFGLMAAFTAAWFIINLFSKKIIVKDKSVLFTIAYLITVVGITLFYSVTGEYTSIYSLNRYVFATPFLSVFFVLLSRYSNSNSKVLLYIYSALTIFTAILFGLINYVLTLNNLALEGIGIFAAYAAFNLLLLIKLNNLRYAIFGYILNMALQLKLLDWFLNGKWVG
jgi:hypothetical protein